MHDERSVPAQKGSLVRLKLAAACIVSSPTSVGLGTQPMNIMRRPYEHEHMVLEQLAHLRERLVFKCRFTRLPSQNLLYTIGVVITRKVLTYDGVMDW